MGFPLPSIENKGILFKYEIEKFPKDGRIKTRKITIGFPWGLAFLFYMILHFLLKWV
jgi:hypothetical protein